jgi:hypothetical protein
MVDEIQKKAKSKRKNFKIKKKEREKMEYLNMAI